jgi:hypothetical protein
MHVTADDWVIDVIVTTYTGCLEALYSRESNPVRKGSVTYKRCLRSAIFAGVFIK